jgi:hypothetical protein
MPQAKKPATRRTSRASKAKPSMTAASRSQLKQAAKRLEKSLDQANDALKALGKDVGHGGHRSYKDISTALSALRRDARKTNRALLDDLGKLRAAVAPSRPSGKRAASSRSSGSRATTKKASSTKKKASSRPSKRRRSP